MKFIRNLLFKSSALIALFALPISAFAGSITFGPITSVPTLRGSMLIVLSLLLMIVAFRVAKQKGSKQFFMVLMGASILMASSGGIKLVSDIQASALGGNIMMAEGQRFDIVNGQINQFNNTSGVTQRVIAISIPVGCTPGGLTPVPACTLGLTVNSSPPSMDNTCFVDCTAAVANKPVE